MALSVSSPNTMSVRGFDQCGEIRMVLLGKTGNGKSASGNTILNQEAFMSRCSPRSVTSQCEKARGVVEGRRVAIIDTPGIYDTKYETSEVIRKLKECICLSAPGPHVFLIVIKLDRFTEEECKSVELLQMVFGEKATDYSLVLFTHGDQLGHTKIEDFCKESDHLTHLIAKCKQRYHVFNNKATDNSQVRQLLSKIARMLRDNGGRFYTNEMFQEAERLIQKRVKEIIQANSEQKKKDGEKLKAKFNGEKLKAALQRLQEKYETKAREKAEKKNSFIETGLIVASAEAGIAIGTAIGALGGPLCIVLGVTLGGLTGAVVGVLVPKAAKALRDKCSVQ